MYCLIYFTCVPLSAPTRVSVIARSQLLDHDPGTVCQYTFANMTSTLDNFFRPQKTYFIVRADSRHQRLVTPCFRRWVQIISLTYTAEIKPNRQQRRQRYLCIQRDSRDRRLGRRRAGHSCCVEDTDTADSRRPYPDEHCRSIPTCNARTGRRPCYVDNSNVLHSQRIHRSAKFGVNRCASLGFLRSRCLRIHTTHPKPHCANMT